MQPNLLDGSLSAFMETGEDVVLALRDGGSLTGNIRDFDPFVVMVSGKPETMVYRHSIMKLLPVSALAAQSERPDRQEPQNARPQKPRTGKTAKKPAPRPPRRAGTDKPAPQIHASESTGFSNPMADALQKWIKNQKAGG